MRHAAAILLALAACGGPGKDRDIAPSTTTPAPTPTTPSPVPTTATPPEPTTPTSGGPPVDLTEAPGVYVWPWDDGPMGYVWIPTPVPAVNVGDTDGDGTDDLAMAGSDFVALVRGPPAAVVDLTTLPLIDDGYPYYHHRISPAGDQTGDGLADLWSINRPIPAVTTPALLFAGTLSGTIDASAAVATVEESDVNGVLDGGHDLDGDGNNDLVVTSECFYDVDGRVQVQKGPFSGDRTEADAAAIVTIHVYDSWFGCFGSVVGDLDGDGIPEIALGASHDLDFSYETSPVTGDVGIWSGDVTGTVDALDATAVVTADAQDVQGFDGDGDGYEDLAMVNASGGAWVLRGPVTADLDLAVAFDAVVLGGTALAPTPDADGDGAEDLLVTSGSTNRVWLIPGSAEGTLGPDEPLWSAVAPAGVYPSLLGRPAAGDFDGDGNPDLVAGSWNCCEADEMDRLWIWPGIGL